MVQHGRACRGCKKPGARQHCPLKDYLKQKGATSKEDNQFGGFSENGVQGEMEN